MKIKTIVFLCLGATVLITLAILGHVYRAEIVNFFTSTIPGWFK